MKKIILAAATAAFVWSSTACASEENTFYLGLRGDWVKMNKTQKLKSKNSADIGISAGYYVLDNTRAEITFSYYIDPSFKGKRNDVNTKVKSKVSNVLLNGYVTLFDVSVAQFFAGAGVGMSMVSGKIESSVEKGKFKKKNNFAWAAHAGVDSEIASGVNVELMYSFVDNGSTKKVALPSGSISMSSKGHHVGAGIRFDL